MARNLFIKSVLITGANRGIGSALVKHFMEQNRLHDVGQTKVIACSRQMNPELIDENVFHVQLDVTDCESINDAVHSASKIVGHQGLNLLINNAGIMHHGKGSLGCSHDELRKTFDTNVIGVHSVTCKFHSLLKMAAAYHKDIPHSCARAAVLNISSELGSIQNTKSSHTTAYRVSKAALNMITKCTSLDLIKDDIICLAIHPGWVRTELGGPRAPLSADESVSDIIEMINKISVEHNGMFISKGLVSEPY